MAMHLRRVRYKLKRNTFGAVVGRLYFPHSLLFAFIKSCNLYVYQMSPRIEKWRLNAISSK